jgi:RNA exonuclease 1
MGLADALGCVCSFLFWPLVLALEQLWLIDSSSSTGITPKASAEGPENVENPNPSNGAVAENANPTNPDTSRSPLPQSPPEKNVLFEAVTSLDAQLTTLHAALPPRTAFLLFSGHSDPRAMSALAARRAEFQASLNQSQSRKQDGGGIAAAVTHAGMTTTTSGNSTGGAGGDANAVRWTTADDRALEEAVGRARAGLLFVGVKA